MIVPATFTAPCPTGRNRIIISLSEHDLFERPVSTLR